MRLPFVGKIACNVGFHDGGELSDPQRGVSSKKETQRRGNRTLVRDLDWGGH